MSDNFRYQSSVTEPALDLRSRTNRDAFLMTALSPTATAAHVRDALLAARGISFDDAAAIDRFIDHQLPCSDDPNCRLR